MAYNPNANIVISGKTFMDVPSVQFKTPNGATVNFAHVGGSIRFSPTLEEQTNNVENFSNAIIDPITSTLLNQLDSDFVAENIKKGVDLFGLLGTLEASAGGGFVSGTITPASSAIQTITYNLGKQPTGIAIWCSLSASKNKKNGVYSVVGDEIGQYCSTYFSTVIEGYLASPISSFRTNCAIAEANDTTFKCALFGQAVSASFATLLTGVEYRWYVW